MFKLGCKKDKVDNRDYLMRAYLPVVKIPKKIDPSILRLRPSTGSGQAQYRQASSGLKGRLYIDKVERQNRLIVLKVVSNRI